MHKLSLCEQVLQNKTAVLYCVRTLPPTLPAPPTISHFSSPFHLSTKDLQFSWMNSSKSPFLSLPLLSTAWLCSSSSPLSFPQQWCVTEIMMAVTLHPTTNTPPHICMEILQHTYMHAHTHAADRAACLPCRLTDIVFYTWSMRQPSLCWRVSSGRWTWRFWETTARAKIVL